MNEKDNVYHLCSALKRKFFKKQKTKINPKIQKKYIKYEK